MKKHVYVLAIVALVGVMFTQASADIMFSDDFTGGPSVNWGNTAAADYTSHNAAFTGTDTRDYIRTIVADYEGADFTATVDLTNGDGPYGCVFFGLGIGTPNSTEYDEPTNGNYVFMRYNGGGFGTLLNTAGSGGLGEGATEPNQAAGSTIRVEFGWASSISTATFRIDTDFNGTYDATYSLTNAAMSGETSRLFIGGTNGASADNFSVTAVPEPSALALSCAGLQWRRGKYAEF